jgi:hypothetical protein
MDKVGNKKVKKHDFFEKLALISSKNIFNGRKMS